MRSFLCRVILGVGVGMAVICLTGPEICNAQPSSGGSVPVDASTQITIKKLVDKGIAAFDAKDYDKAIALYMRAFSLNPHPLLLFNVAQAFRLSGCPERAIAFYARYLTLEPNGTESATARAFLSQIKGTSSSQNPASAASSHCASADALMESLTAPAANPTGRIKLHSTPDGMAVMLDGVKIGATPVERELPAGSHMVALVSGGRLLGERKVEIEAGEIAEVTIPVESLPDERQPRGASSRLAPALLWAGGGAALVGSGVLFYLGQKGGPDHPRDPYVYAGATPAGVAFAVAGAGAIGVGVWLWIRGSRESAPIATIGPGGSYLGWQGRF